MRSTSPSSSAFQPAVQAAGYRPSSDRRRGTALVLTILGHLLLVWLLLHLVPPASPPKEPGQATTFTILPPGDTNASSTQARRAPARAASATRRRTDPTPPAQARPAEVQPPVPPIPVTPLIPGMIVLSKQDFAASDVGKLRSQKAGGSAGQQVAAADGAGDGTDSVAQAGPGAGPGGQRLYNAEWYREPTDSQLAPFLPNTVPPGAWAEIACRTTPNYGVEDCRQLGDSRPGSGLSRGLREAAWQFKVRPPRINGKPVIGAWVRIHFDFTKQR